MAHAQAKPDPENHAIPGSARPQRSLPLCLLFLGALLAGSGCATYSDHTAGARNYAQRGDYDSAIAELDKLLGVEDGHAHPEKFRDDSALVLLERGMLHQARGDYDGSREDLQVLPDFTRRATFTQRAEHAELSGSRRSGRSPG